MADPNSGRCDSCGRDDEEVVAVHRVYVTPESWDTEGKTEVVDEVERWCFVCRTHYPHGSQLGEGLHERGQRVGAVEPVVARDDEVLDHVGGS